MSSIFARISNNGRMLLVLVACSLAIAAAVATVTGWLFVRSQATLQDEVQEKLRTHAAIAAMQFSSEEVAAIRDERDMGTGLFRTLVGRAKRIQQSLPDAAYVYIMRRTDDPTRLAFVIEDDMLDSLEELDENGDGVLQTDEETVVPGDLFDIADVPAMQSDAWSGPATDLEITHDQWGSWMSGYAPIRDRNGNAVAILGIDMDAAHFIATTQRIFSPIALLLIILGTLVTTATITFILWHRRLSLLRRIDEHRRTLVKVASHKLGGPIATIRWWSDILDDSSKKQDDKEAHKELHGAIERLSQVAKHLDDATHVEGMTEKELHTKLAKETAEELRV